MKVLVCVKVAAMAATSAHEAFDRAGRVGAAVLAAHDRHGVEGALRIAESNGASEVVVVALSDAECSGALREALAMGCHRAVLLTGAQEGDALAAAKVLAVVIGRESPAVALYCPWPGDIEGSLIWIMTAQNLGWPALMQARSVTVQDGVATCRRQIEAADITIAAELPCLVEITAAANKPRYPTLKGRQAARGLPLAIQDVSEFGIDPAATRATRLGAVMPQVWRRNPVLLKADAAIGEAVADFLQARGLW